ncbi:hypothetical protein BASA83_009189 [Batrachochytrium salamandrivorans]|nr:hypothetical protein BASA83_009189 [Batrachochytrium salamandrivorans]
MSRYTLSTTHPTPAAQLTPDCPVSDFSGLSVLPDTSPEPPIHSPTIPENFENFHFFHDFDPPGMVSDDSESMVPLGDHLTSPVKILTRSLIIHGHVSKLENFHTLLKDPVPPHPPHPASGPGKRGIALGFLAVLPAREIEGVPGTLILAKVPGLTEQQVWTVGSIPGKTDRQATLKLVERALELATRDHNRPIIIGGDWNAPHATLQRKVSSWGLILQYQFSTVGCIEQPPRRLSVELKMHIELASIKRLYFESPGNHTRKAPGDDGITTALMQAIAHDPKDHGTGDVNLDRPGALALLRVANTIFLSGVIPKVWRCATIISIPKKGDATLASNLRGISLINVGLKILCKMVQARLSSLLESNNVLVPEQGGFRTREESTAQVCALMDILRRRQIADLNSHIAFIDISKAFDTVPIHALLFKLRCIGIPTITMNFCLPCLSQEHHPRGLMFADDIAIIAPSHESLCTSMGTIADWATRWEMSFGVAKCAKKKRAITAAAHSISPLLRNNALSTRYRLTIFNGLVLGVAYYGLELIGGNHSPRSSTSSACQYRHSHDSQGPLIHPIAPMLTDCGIISLDAHAILARVRLTVKATTLKTPLRTLLLPSTIPSHSNSWFWTRRSRSLIRFVHPNMSLFHFNIPISTNGLFHNPISTNSSITSSNISRSIQTPNPYTPESLLHPLLSPTTPTIAEIRHQRSKYALERTFQVWGKSKLACSYVQANHASSAKFLRSPALSTGQAIGPLSSHWPAVVAYGTILGHSRQVSYTPQQKPYQLGSPSLYTLSCSLGLQAHGPLGGRLHPPHCVFSRVDTQLLQAINDTRVQIFDCTLHTTTTTTTTTTTPASPSFSTTSSNSNPDSTGTSAIWDSMDIILPSDNYQHSPRTTSQSFPQVPLAAPLIFNFSFHHIVTRHGVSSRPISVAHQEILPAGPRTQWKKTPLPAGRTTTDTHTAAISSTPTPTQISYIGSDDILTVLLGGEPSWH